jgi:hypothetical protein
MGMYLGRTAVIVNPKLILKKPATWTETCERQKPKFAVLDSMVWGVVAHKTVSTKALAMQTIERLVIVSHIGHEIKTISSLARFHMDKNNVYLMQCTQKHPIFTLRRYCDMPFTLVLDLDALELGRLHVIEERYGPPLKGRKEHGRSIAVQESGDVHHLIQICTSIVVVDSADMKVCTKDEIGTIWCSSVECEPSESSASFIIEGMVPKLSFMLSSYQGFLWPIQPDSPGAYDGSSLMKLFLVGDLQNVFRIGHRLYHCHHIEKTIESCFHHLQWYNL